MPPCHTALPVRHRCCCSTSLQLYGLLILCCLTGIAKKPTDAVTACNQLILLPRSGGILYTMESTACPTNLHQHGIFTTICCRQQQPHYIFGKMPSMSTPLCVRSTFFSPKTKPLLPYINALKPHYPSFTSQQTICGTPLPHLSTPTWSATVMTFHVPRIVNCVLTTPPSLVKHAPLTPHPPVTNSDQKHPRCSPPPPPH